MGFTKALLISGLKIFYLMKPSLIIKYGEMYLGALLTSMISVISLETLNKIFFEEADIKHVWIPIVIQVVMTFLYLLIVFIDFIYGTRVALNVHKKKFDLLRVLDTITKTFATIIVTSLLWFFCLCLEALNIPYATVPAVLALMFIWAVIILYEYSSIGDHIKSLYGKKPGTFTFMDNIAGKIREKAIKRVESSFNLNTETNETDNDINTN